MPCSGAIWRRREKPQWCTTTVPQVHKSCKISLKIYFLYNFWCAQTCSFRAVFVLPIRIVTTAVSATKRHAEKILYRCASTFSALNYCGGIFFKVLSYLSLFEVGLTNFSADFWTMKTESKSTHKSWNTCSIYVPHAQADQVWQTKNAIFSHLQPAHGGHR